MFVKTSSQCPDTEKSDPLKRYIRLYFATQNPLVVFVSLSKGQCSHSGLQTPNNLTLPHPSCHPGILSHCFLLALFLECCQTAPASGPLHRLFPLPRSLNEWDHLREVFHDHLLPRRIPYPLPCLVFLHDTYHL